MRLMPYLLRVCFRRADAVIAVSQGVADEVRELMRLPEGRVKVIYNPIVTPEMKRRHPPCRRRAGQPPTVIAIGRLTPQKDFSTLIRAFAIVRREREAKLLILGQGEEHDVLQSLVASYGIQDDVEMIGFKADPFPYLFSAAAFVLSSRWEGLPGVLIEALFSGVPVVATDCPSGPREILNDGEYGRLVPVGDPNALADGITDALDGKVPVAPERSWSPYDSEKVVRQYLEVLTGELNAK
jgi:glycosyltransferase involved in cell wall biosynthesis